MTEETAWQIEQVIDGESIVTYMRSDDVAGRMMEKDNVTVTSLGYEDPRSEWECALSNAEMFGSEIDTDIDAESAATAMNFDKIEAHYDDGTGEELKRVGENWNDVSETERVSFVLLYEKFRRMARKAEAMIESKYWGGST